jgi:Trk-type K+ transport system membrane component
MLRAQRQIAEDERAQEGEWAELIPDARSSQVVARSTQQQSRLERRSPARSITTSFVGLIAVGTLLLMLPGMRWGESTAPLGVALFTATSASCVTGLAVVDTGTYWTPLGQATILLLIQVGGFGIQALGTLWILLLTRRLGSRSRLAAQAETGALTQGDVRQVLIALGSITVVVETAVAVMLTARFALGYDQSLPRAAWMGLFHSVSAFNNAGFALASDSLMTYGHDVLILGPIGLAIILGGLGFLVIVELVSRATGARPLVPRRKAPQPMTVEQIAARGRELARRSRYRLGDLHPERLGFGNPIPLSLHTRLMLIGTGLIMAVGTLGFALFEWTNPATLGAMPWWERLVQSVFSGGITPRTAGFNTVDYAEVSAETRFLTDGLMFTGGGSGSTAGGIKITTLMVLVMAVLAEVRGHRDVNTLDRRIPDTVVRIAIAVLMVSFAAVMIGTMWLIWLTELDLDLAMFEVISALATVGLSANVTPTLPEPAQLLLVGLMLLGRVGPLTLASSLTLRTTPRDYRLPEGRPMIG